MYGAKKIADAWSGGDIGTVIAVWDSALANLTRAEIDAGFASLVQSGSPFPPTLPEFFAACRPPIALPPASDHRALDRLAREYGVAIDCESYAELRHRIARAMHASGARTLMLELEDRREG